MNTPTVREVQQMFAELLSFYGDDISWDLLTENQPEILTRKINELYNTSNRFMKKYADTKRIFTNIWEQRKFTNGQSLTAVFFVMIVDDVNHSKLAEQSRSWSLYPAFRCRRCVDDNSGRNHSGMDCCMIYVSHLGVFQNWNMFLKLAYQDSGYMVAPNRGVYKLVNGQVELKTYPLTNYHGLSQKRSARCIDPGKWVPEPGTENVYHSFPFVRKCTSKGIYFELLEECYSQKSEDLQVSDLSSSLVLFTHSVKNFRLASKMVTENSCHGVLSRELRIRFHKIARETSFIKERANPIRCFMVVPSKSELDENLKRIVWQHHTEGFHQDLMDVEEELQQIYKVRVKDEYIDLENYGQALMEHILSRESFEDLIASMSDNLEPEMFKLILKLTQNFLENSRQELLQLLKYHFSTETVLYQIILCILRCYSNMDFKDIEEQSADILRRVRYYFAAACPNSRPEFLKKCPKCVGYFDDFVK